MWGLLIKLLGGGFIERIADTYRAKITADADRFKIGVDADKAVILGQMQADVEAKRIAAASRGPVWMVALFVVPYAFHNAAIVLDSVFRFEWNVDKLPAPFDQTEHAVIWSVCGIAAGAVAFRRIFSR